MNHRKTYCIVLATVLFLAGEKSHARWMSPNTGRFRTMDAYEGDQANALGLHKYLYCEANPVDNRDPSGEDIGELALDFGLSFAAPQISAVKNALQEVPVQVVTSIRPPDPKDGVKTRHTLGVNGFGVVTHVQQYIGITRWKYLPLKGKGTFVQSADSNWPTVAVHMAAEAWPVGLGAFNLAIRYGFEVQLNFANRRGHLSGFHEGYPSYVVVVHGKQVYDFQQKSIGGLAGFNLENPEIDFAW
jgi:hypothetical protein